MEQKGNCSYVLSPNTSTCDSHNLSSPRNSEEQMGSVPHLHSEWSHGDRTLCHQSPEGAATSQRGVSIAWPFWKLHLSPSPRGTSWLLLFVQTLSKAVTRKLREGEPEALLLAEEERDHIQIFFPAAGSQVYLLPPPRCQHLGNALISGFAGMPSLSLTCSSKMIPPK